MPPPKESIGQRDSSNKRLGQGLSKEWEEEVSVQARSLTPIWWIFRKKGTEENLQLHRQQHLGACLTREAVVSWELTWGAEKTNPVGLTTSLLSHPWGDLGLSYSSSSPILEGKCRKEEKGRSALVDPPTPTPAPATTTSNLTWGLWGRKRALNWTWNWSFKMNRAEFLRTWKNASDNWTRLKDDGIWVSYC